MTGILTTREEFGGTQREDGHAEVEAETTSDPATNQSVPRGSNNHKKLGRILP